MQTSRKSTVIAVFVTAIFASLAVGGAMASASPPGGNFNVAYAQFPAGPGDFIHLYGWEPGSSLTISIDDPGVPGIDYEVTGIVASSTEGFNVDIGSDFDIQSGHTVTVSDGSTSQSLLVTNLEIRSVAPETGLVSGVGEPGMLTMVTPDYVTVYWVTPGADGTWQVDMSDYDLRLEGVAAQQLDDNGNSTQFDYLVTASPPQSRADCKRGGWQDFTDDVGTPFRNQGECVSYVATSGPQGPAPR